MRSWVWASASKAVVRTRLRIDNACCEAEATLAKKTLHAIAGVDKVSVNVVGRIAYATHRPHLVGAQALADALNEHNLGASVAAAPEAADNVEEPVDYKELAFVAALLLGLALGYVIPSLLVVVAVGGAAPLARDAVRGALLQKRLDVNALMLCAVLGALGRLSELCVEGNLLRELPDDLSVYPGHSYGGEKTTIRAEKANGLLRPFTRDQWRQMHG